MSLPAAGASSLAAETDPASHRADEIARHARRNFLALAAQQIIIRIGWIFKTESIVMPAVVDMLSGAGWVRGSLPLFNRLGLSIPPLLSAGAMQRAPRKRVALGWSVLGMGGTFLLLAALWPRDGAPAPAWLAPVFLVLYSVFFAFTGISHVAHGALTGKLVAASRRGRLLSVANVAGTVLAVAAACLLMPYWLSATEADFRSLFLFVGGCFTLAALVSWRLAEPADTNDAPVRHPLAELAHLLGIVRRDRNFALTALVAMLFSSSLMLFPHYQSLGRERLDLPLTNILWWVVLQNVGTGVFSIVAGPLADRRGTRLALHGLLFGVGLAPLAALALAWAGPSYGPWYGVVFVLVGLTPVAYRTLTHYTLEIGPEAEHPQYLAILNLCNSLPVLFSPLAGWLADTISSEAVFAAIALLVLAGCGLSFWLLEPRHGDGAAAP